MDGLFKAFAISLPENSELLDRIPEADPTLLHEVGGGLGWGWGGLGCRGVCGCDDEHVRIQWKRRMSGDGLRDSGVKR